MSSQLRPDELEQEFAAAWSERRHTAFIRPALDINELLSTRPNPAHRPLTGKDLWTIEVSKALDPERFIPHVVASGSARTWDHHRPAPGIETFCRMSAQRLLFRSENYGLVLERVLLDHRRRVALFLGTAQLPGPDGTVRCADSRQPLFHVEHSVGGTEERPLNLWRVVHLTDEPDGRLLRSHQISAAGRDVPVYVQVYLQGASQS